MQSVYSGSQPATNAFLALMGAKELISPALYHPRLHEQSSPWTTIILDYIGRPGDEKKGSVKDIQNQKMRLSFQLQFESRETSLFTRFFRTRISNIIFLYCDGFCFETLRLVSFYTPTIRKMKNIKQKISIAKPLEIKTSVPHMIGSDPFEVKRKPFRKESFFHIDLLRKGRNRKKAFGHLRQKERNIKQENLTAKTGGIFGYDDAIDSDNSDQDWQDDHSYDSHNYYDSGYYDDDPWDYYC